MVNITTKIIKALLVERLAQYTVPAETINAISDDIVHAINAPEAGFKSRGAVMTPEASANADRIKRGENIPPEFARPTKI